MRLTKKAPRKYHDRKRGITLQEEDFENIHSRLKEADEFYSTIIPSSLGADESNVMRQALAGMLWSKQFFNYDVGKWLKEHGVNPSKSGQRNVRNDRVAPHEIQTSFPCLTNGNIPGTLHGTLPFML